MVGDGDNALELPNWSRLAKVTIAGHTGPCRIYRAQPSCRSPNDAIPFHLKLQALAKLLINLRSAADPHATVWESRGWETASGGSVAINDALCQKGVGFRIAVKPFWHGRTSRQFAIHVWKGSANLSLYPFENKTRNFSKRDVLEGIGCGM